MAATEASTPATTTATPATAVTPPAESTHRKILIAMDGSEHAEYALQWYCDNGHKKEDEVILVYVPELHDFLHSSGWAPSMYQYEREAIESMVKEEHDRISSKLNVFADMLKKHGLHGKVESVISKKPGDGILKAAETEDVSIIIMGSRGQNTLRRTFMGSISDYVVHHSHVPVLVCKHPHKHAPGHHGTH